MDSIGLYIVGALALAGGFEFTRWSFKNSDEDDRNWARTTSFERRIDPGNMGITVGLGLICFGALALFGGYQGWTAIDVLGFAKDNAGSVIDYIW